MAAGRKNAAAVGWSSVCCSCAARNSHVNRLVGEGFEKLLQVQFTILSSGRHGVGKNSQVIG
jgi:hypothetical protein